MTPLKGEEILEYAVPMAVYEHMACELPVWRSTDPNSSRWSIPGIGLSNGSTGKEGNT